eukprot:216828_1
MSHTLTINSICVISLLFSIVLSDAPFGSTWYKSTKDITLIKTTDITQWNLTKAHGEDINIVTQFNAHSIKNIGDEARFVMKWNSNGIDKCPSEYWESSTYNYQCEQLPQQYIESCAHQSVHCLAGTGDFRI